ITFNWSGGYISQVVEGGGVAVRNLTYTGGQLTNIAVVNSQNQTLHSVQYNYSGGLVSSLVRDGDAGSAINLTYVPYASNDGGVVMLANENDSSGHATNISYGVTPSAGAAQTSTVANAAGNITTYDFNALGDIIKITTPTLTGASGATVVTFTYDANRQVT